MQKSKLALFIIFIGLSLLLSSYSPANGSESERISSGCTPVPSGLVYWLRGQYNADDFTGQHDGSLFGGTSFVTGKVGKAFSLYGDGEYIVIPSHPDLPHGSDPRTIEMWVYSAESSWLNDFRTLFYTGINTQRKAFGIDFEVYPSLQFYTWADDLSVDSAVPMIGWFHVAMVYDGNTLIKAYTNGVERGSRTLGGLLDTFNGETFIGSGVNSIGNPVYFYGGLDEVTMYNRALSSSEILNIYNAGSFGKCIYGNYLPLLLNQ